MKLWVLLIVTASTGIAACAGTGPRSTEVGARAADAAPAPDLRVAAAAVDADPAPELQAAARTDAGADDDGVICRRVEVTGTHRRVRVCTTREEREAMRQQSQEVLRDTLFERAGPGSPEGAN